MIYAFSGIFAVVVAIIQASLTRALTRARSGGARGLLLFIKFPLWAGFFIVLAIRSRGALLIGGATAAAGYLALAIWWRKRLH